MGWESEGRLQPKAGTASHSPLVPIIVRTWVLVFPLEINALYFVGPAPLLEERLPFVIAGVLLGWSLWHVARRLYGNSGGYIALALYSFSPLMIVASATVGHDLIASWGMFGAVFTAIALAHTLLAPPADRIRRTLLLGAALGVGIGADYTVVIALPVALALMLYLTPQRHAAGVTWLAPAAGVAALVLWAAFFFDAGAMLAALGQARFFALRPAYVSGGIPYHALVKWLLATLPALVLFGVALIAFLRSARSRYFGNALPLVIGGTLFLMSLATPYY
ncbi:MAG: ArnT family glycosyltransferase, partial [Terriglobales bacterium]